MKYFTLIIISAMITQSSIAQSTIASYRSKNDELLIRGTLYNINEPIPYVYIFILKISDDHIDSVKVINNQYVYKTKITGISFVTLCSKSPNDPDWMENKNTIPLLLGPDTSNILSTDSFCNFNISGSKAYTEYVKLDHITKHPSKKGVCMPSPDPIRYYNYVKENPASILASYALFCYAKAVPAEDIVKVIKPLYDRLPISSKGSYFGKRVEIMIDAKNSFPLIKKAKS
jgi:hypothetical protein